VLPVQNIIKEGDMKLKITNRWDKGNKKPKADHLCIDKVAMPWESPMENCRIVVKSIFDEKRRQDSLQQSMCRFYVSILEDFYYIRLDCYTWKESSDVLLKDPHARFAIFALEKSGHRRQQRRPSLTWKVFKIETYKEVLDVMIGKRVMCSSIIDLQI